MSVDWHFGHALEVRMLVLVTVVCDQPFGIGPLFGVCDNDLAEIYRTSKHPTCPGQISPVLLQRMSPFMAQSGRAVLLRSSPLSGVKRPRLWLGRAAANDPKRTTGASIDTHQPRPKPGSE